MYEDAIPLGRPGHTHDMSHMGHITGWFVLPEILNRQSKIINV
jgi:hypothetical protein